MIKVCESWASNARPGANSYVSIYGTCCPKASINIFSENVYFSDYKIYRTITDETCLVETNYGLLLSECPTVRSSQLSYVPEKRACLPGDSAS